MPNKFKEAQERYLRSGSIKYDPVIMEALKIAERTSSDDCGCLIMPCAYHREHGIGKPNDHEEAASTIPGVGMHKTSRAEVTENDNPRVTRWWRYWR